MFNPILFSLGSPYYKTPIITSTDSTSSASNLSFYSFAGRSLGTAASDRLIVVTVGVANTTINNVTVAGVVLTKAINVNGVCIAYGLIPTGTTGTVEIDTFGTGGGCKINIYKIVNYNSILPIAAISDSGISISISTNTPNKAVAIACCRTEDENAGLGFPAPLTEISDQGVGTKRYGSAYTATPLTWDNTSFAITSNYSTTILATLVIWR